jgi:hypothetical protein
MSCRDDSATVGLFRRAVRASVPSSIRAAVQSWLARRRTSALAASTPGEAFDAIYRQRMWGTSARPEEPFCSGIGSRDPRIVEPYVASVRRWLESFPERPSVVDLGCGDFHVGSRIRDACGPYVACDCVAAMIDHHREAWSHLDVEFRVHDATTTPCPEATVVFIRQVLQHLSNDLVARALAGVAGRCDWLVVTEHVPAGDFRPNQDKPLGPGVRLSAGSGVVITAPPFSMDCRESHVICDVEYQGSRIVTTAYRMR